VRRSACLAVVCVLLAAMPVLAQVRGAPGIVAVVPPPLSSVPTNSNGCTPSNPCAVATPLGGLAMSAPEAAPQSNPSGTTETPAAPPAAGRAATAQANCPAPGARGGRGPTGRGEGRGAFAGRGYFAGRGGEGRGAFAGRGRGLPPNCLPQGPGRGNPANPAGR